MCERYGKVVLSRAWCYNNQTERESIQDGYEKLNNAVIKKCAKDKDVRIGSKNPKKFWIGYKKHVGADAQSGMITKVAVTKANVTDAAEIKHVLPNFGAVLADKGYVGAIGDIKEGLHQW